MDVADIKIILGEADAPRQPAVPKGGLRGLVPAMRPAFGAAKQRPARAGARSKRPVVAIPPKRPASSIARVTCAVTRGRFGNPVVAALPLDRLKIDGALVRAMTQGPKDMLIVRAILLLGREFGFTTLAEGVATEEQFGLLKDLGREDVQGYVPARPSLASTAADMMSHAWGARVCRTEPRDATAP